MGSQDPPDWIESERSVVDHRISGAVFAVGFRFSMEEALMVVLAG